MPPPTITEDSIRRNELAALGITAEVDTGSDGYSVVRLTTPELDQLTSTTGHDDCPTHSDMERQWSAGQSEGFDKGHVVGYRAALSDIKALT